MTIKRYIKKPLIIEAVQLHAGNASAVAEWCGGVVKQLGNLGTNPATITIPTLEGEMRADSGAFIVKGIKGEFYPVQPDIFLRLHDEVNEDYQPR